MTQLIILGAAGTARDILDWLPALAAAGCDYRCLGLLDDDPAKRGTFIGGVEVVGTLSDAARWPDVRVIDALGGPRSYRRRGELLARTGIRDDRFDTVVHPQAVVSRNAQLGAGCVIYPFSFVGPDVRLGRHVTVLSHGSINHDCSIGDCAILASHAALAGGVTVEDHCYIGMGARIIQHARIGRGAMVGMGAVVLKDVAADATVVGNPARPRTGRIG
ncbi:MAG: acetyltransferase [Gemmatimonadales bacterium]